MKFNKNNIQIISLFISAISLVFALFTIMFDANKFDTNNIYLMTLLTVFISCIASAYIMLIIKRVNPKQYIYMSFSSADKDMVELVTRTLEEQFKKMSKYRFEILTADTIPYGSDMRKTMQEYLQKANIMIVIVSKSYIESKWCNEEFVEISGMNKKIIPIVIDRYEYLSQLPKDISNIKALFIRESKLNKELEHQIELLAKDLVRQRKD